jgi:HD-GYP domain-containing protein (c-di-GMP phosphodiesterase class II)
MGEASLVSDMERTSALVKKKAVLIFGIIITAAICLAAIMIVLIGGGKADVYMDVPRSLIVCLAAASVLLVVIAGAMLLKLCRQIINLWNAVFESISSVAAQKEINTLTKEKEPNPAILVESSDTSKLDKLISLISNINRSHSFEEVLKYIYSAFKAFVPYEYIGIALIKEDGKTLEAAYGISDGTIKGLPEGLLGRKVDIHKTSLGKVVETGNARIINDLEKYTYGKPIKEYNSIIMSAGICSSITLPLVIGTKPVGIIFFSSTRKNAYTEEHAAFLETVASSIAISFEKNIFVDDLLYSSVLALAKLAEARDEDTGEHMERMRVYAREIAILLHQDEEYSNEISPGFIKNIERFSPMHDIGKVGIRDGILLKPGKLTDEELEEMKHHTVYGAEVLRAADQHMARNGNSLFKPGIEIAESHHEKWDGTGYPYGKKGEEIPLSARIVAVADVFDALTSKRPYKEAYSFDEAFEMILNESGKHFDPGIIRVFGKNRERIHSIYKSFLTAGKFP